MLSRGKGAVINMSSFSAHCGPLLSVYSGSKAFVIQFSSDLEVHFLQAGYFWSSSEDLLHPDGVQRPRHHDDVRRPVLRGVQHV